MAVDPLSREHAAALDESDPLAGMRERFVVADPGRIYLDGNSLGRLPVATRGRLGRLTEEWGERLVAGWEDWIELPERAGDVVAEVIGAGPGEVVVCDSVTVNLYKLASAACAGREGALVTDARNFPTDRYVLEGLAAAQGRELRLFEGEPPLEDAALLVLSHVDYRTGELLDLPAITAACRAAAVPVIWDLCHSAGAVPVDLRAAGVQLAVGCTYKYLNAGPGAPAFLYVAGELQASMRSPIWGWFGQREQFDMDRPYDPEPGVRRFMAGTPPILGLVAVEEGARMTAEAGIRPLREKSLAQTELLVALHDAWLAPLGFELGSPRDPSIRGSHVALRHPEAWPINRALIDVADVVPDFRGPDSIRLGIAPLYTRYVDVWDALDRLRRLVRDGEHHAFAGAKARVT